MISDKEKIVALLEEIQIKNVYKLETYKGVILAYDADFDQRLKQVVDQVVALVPDTLFMVHEEDGTLTMIWNDEVPASFNTGSSIPTTYHNGTIDYWFIGFSKSLEAIHWNDSREFIALHHCFSKN